MRHDDFENTAAYLQKLDARTRVTLKADINGLKSHLRHTVGSLPYWARRKPFLAFLLVAVTGGLIKRRKRPLKPSFADSLLDPIIRHMTGLAATSVLSFFLLRNSGPRQMSTP